MERRTENRLRQRSRVLHHWCPAKRLAAFILSFAMLIVNIGNSAAVAMAAEGNSRHVEFQMNQEDVWTAVKEALSAGGGITAESFNFAQGDLEGIRELLAGGQLFEITNGVKYDAYPDTEGAELRVFIRIPGDGDPGNYRLTGKEKLIFMYMNSGEGDLSASVKIVGEETGEIVVNTGEILVESYQKAFGGSDEEVDEEKLPAQTEQMEPAQGNPNSAGEMAGSTDRVESADGEETAGNEEMAVGDETTAGEEVIAGEENSGSESADGTEAGTEAGAEDSSGSTGQETLDNAAADGEEADRPEQDEGDVSSEKEAEDKAETEVKPETGTGEEAEEKGDSHDEESAEGTSGEVSAEKPEAAEKEEVKSDHDGGDAKEPEKADTAEEKAGDAEGASDNHADADNSSDTLEGDENEEGQKLSKSENQVRIVAESAGDKDGLVAVGENTTARVIVMELSATGFVAEDEEEVPADVPEEVKKFLEAVKELPAPEMVTGENAEEIGEKVNAAIDMWEGLADFGLGYEEREDVSAAMETVYAVFEKVLEAEEIEENIYSDAQLPYESSEGVKKSAFENAYNLGQSDTCYGIVKLNGNNETDSGTPNVWATGGWGGSVNVTGYNWVHITNTNPDVATAIYKTEGGKLTIIFKPGESSGTTKISVGVDAKYPHYSLGTWNMELNFDYTVTNGIGEAAGSSKYADIIRSVTYDLSTGEATWGKEPYDGRYGKRTSASSSCIFDFKDPWGYWFSFYPTKATHISVGEYNTSIASVETYSFTTENSYQDDDNNTTQAWTGFKVTGLKAGETVVDITTEYDVQSIRWNNSGWVWSVDDNRAVVTKLYIKVIGEKQGNQYMLTYDANGGSLGKDSNNNNIATQTITHRTSADSSEFTIVDTIPVREDYTFKGWADSKTAETAQYTADDKITLYKANPTKTIYAVWEKEEPITYTVTYTDGVEGEIVFTDQGYEGLKKGSATPKFEKGDKGTEEVTDSDGKKFVRPKREGFTFMGWAPAVAETVTGDVTYVATWQKNQEPKITGIEKKLVKNDSNIPNDVKQALEYGGKEITYPNAEGKVIIPKDESVNLLYTITVTGDPGKEYKVTDTGAIWIAGDTMHGTLSDSREAVIWVCKSFTASNINKEGKLENKAKVTPGKDGESSSTSTETTPAEEEKQYTLIYDTNGGYWSADNSKDHKDIKNTSSASCTFTISSQSPTRDGYTFKGWADAPSKEVKYKSELELTEADKDNGITDKITLTQPQFSKTIYAVWVQDVKPPVTTYTVKYEWDLPDEATPKHNKPEDKSYKESDTVTVDSTSYNNVTVGTGESAKTYKFEGWEVPKEITVTDGTFSMPAENVTITGVWKPVEPIKTSKLEVVKTNKGFKVDPQTGDATVDYTVEITNKSGVTIYGLRLTDILDEPTVTAIKLEDKGKGSVECSFSNFQVDGAPVKSVDILQSEKKDDGSTVHVLQLLDRNAEFKDEQTVTLTYTIKITNLNNVAVKVYLHNTAEGASWSKTRNTTPVSLFSMSRSTSAAAANTDDEPDVTGKDDSTASSGETDDEPDVFGKDDSDADGETGDGGDSETEGELPEKYTVTYEWSGLPKEANIKEPAQSSYPAATATVKVDTEYTKDKKVVVDDKTYTFSGWTTTDAEVEDGKFTMPEHNVTIHGIWTPDNSDSKHKVTVHYVYKADNTKAADDEIRDNLAEGTEYSITSPDIDGYTPDKPVVSGTMGTEDIVVTVMYTKNSSGDNGEDPGKPDPDKETITATWLPGYGDNTPIQTEDYDKGTTKVPEEDYPENPVREGYTFTRWGDPVFDEEGNITITAQWTPVSEVPNPETHKVTIHYLYANGSKAADDAVRDNLTEGTAYSITSPAISGYTPDQSIVSGTMGTEDIEITVTYTRRSSGGSSSGGGGGGSNTTNLSGRVHGTAPAVPENDVPLAEIPDGTNIPDEEVPLANAPVDIPDADVPLAGFPQWNIPDEEVPLAAVPRTGDSSGLWHMMAFLSAFGLMTMSLLERRKRHE